MLESFNYETTELCATNHDLQTYIDIFHNESERHAMCPEQSTAHFENAVTITVDSDSVLAQKKK